MQSPIEDYKISQLCEDLALLPKSWWVACKMKYSPTITLEAAGAAEDRVFFQHLPVPVLKVGLVWQKIKMWAFSQSI